MSIKLQMLGGAGGRAASFPKAPRAPFFLRRGLNSRLNLFLLPRRGGKCRRRPGRGLRSGRAEGDRARRGLWSLVAGRHGGIPGNSSKILASESWCDLEETPSRSAQAWLSTTGLGAARRAAQPGAGLAVRREQGLAKSLRFTRRRLPRRGYEQSLISTNV